MTDENNKYRALRDCIWGSELPGVHRAIALRMVEHYPEISPSIQSLVKHTGFCRTTVIKTLAELQDWGVIVIGKVHGRRSTYRFSGRWTLLRNRSVRRTGARNVPVCEANPTGMRDLPPPVREAYPKQTSKADKKAANVEVEFASPTATSLNELTIGSEPTHAQALNDSEPATPNAGDLGSDCSMRLLVYSGPPERVLRNSEAPGGGRDESAAQHASRPKPQASGAVKELFTYWQGIHNHPGSKLDGKRRALAARQLKEYGMGTLKAAIRGAKKSPYHQGDNERKCVYDDFELILRGAKHIEKFAGYDRKAPNKALASPNAASRSRNKSAQGDHGMTGLENANVITLDLTEKSGGE